MAGVGWGGRHLGEGLRGKGRTHGLHSQPVGLMPFICNRFQGGQGWQPWSWLYHNLKVTKTHRLTLNL